MATRRETTKRRVELNEALRAACRSGALQSGEMLPSVRELALQHRVSMKVVCETIATLVEEGLLYTVPRVGTFVGQLPVETNAPYLFVSHFLKPILGTADHMRVGFEERIAQLGGACLSLDRDEVSHHWQHGSLPQLSGVFEVRQTPSGRGLAESGVRCAVFDELEVGGPPMDVVNFDNEEGGILATRHLLSMGHSRIAFLALHNEHSEPLLLWSKQREQGWRRVMVETRQDPDDLVFRPETNVAEESQGHWHAGNDLAKAILARPDITAVVVVNVIAAQGYLQALRDSGISMARWPAIVCFDSAPDGGASGISYIRLPWEKIGSEAAQLLWDRKNGRVSGAPVTRLVPMQLIPSLTSRSDWAVTSTLVQTQAQKTNPSLSETG